IVNNHNFGVDVDGSTATTAVTGVIKNSTINNNTGPGIQVTSSAIGTNVLIDTVNVANHPTGINVMSSFGTARLTNSVITQNTTGLATSTSGSIISLGNNSLGGNGTDGAPTSTIAVK